MQTGIPAELGPVGDAPEDAARLADIADHVQAVLRHRVLTPAEQVMILVEVAVSIVAAHVGCPTRGMMYLAGLTGRTLAIARQIAQERSLRTMPPAGSAMTLVWAEFNQGKAFRAACGEAGQGEVRVGLSLTGWHWSVDMLPGDGEPYIRGGPLASADEAKAAAESQVAAWPSLIEGAWRI